MAKTVHTTIGMLQLTDAGTARATVSVLDRVDRVVITRVVYTICPCTLQ